MTNNLENDVLSLLASGRANAAAEYAARGRSFSTLTDAELADEWTDAFKAMAADYTDQPLRARHSDLQAEFDLRSLAPPFERVRAEHDQYTKAASGLIEQIKQDDPDGYDQIADGLNRDLAAHKQALKN